MKCPLVGRFLGTFYFNVQIYKPCLKDGLHMKLFYIWIIGSREEEVYMYFPV